MIGKIFKGKLNGKRIKIVKKYSGNGHWTCVQLDGGKKTHHIHEGTLKTKYEEDK